MFSTKDIKGKPVFPIEIYFDEHGFNQSTNSVHNYLEAYQKCVDEYVSLNIQNPFKENDLIDFISNPKGFLAKKISNGEVLKVGDLTIGNDKLFDLIDKPENYLQVVQNVERILKDANIPFPTECPDWFTVVDNKVSLKSDFIDKFRKQHSIFIETEQQLQDFKDLEEIAEKLTKFSNKKHYNMNPSYFLQYAFTFDHNKINNLDETFKVDIHFFNNNFKKR